MTKTTIANIKNGDILNVGYRGHLDRNQFLGFYTDGSFTGAGYATLSELRSNVADQDTYYAKFLSLDGDYTWGAYRWNGRWRVGSSADMLQLAAI